MILVSPACPLFIINVSACSYPAHLAHSVHSLLCVQHSAALSAAMDPERGSLEHRETSGSLEIPEPAGSLENPEPPGAPEPLEAPEPDDHPSAIQHSSVLRTAIILTVFLLSLAAALAINLPLFFRYYRGI